MVTAAIRISVVILCIASIALIGALVVEHTKHGLRFLPSSVDQLVESNVLLGLGKEKLIQRLGEPSSQVFSHTAKDASADVPNSTWKDHWIYEGGFGEPNLVVAFDQFGLVKDCFIEM